MSEDGPQLERGVRRGLAAVLGLLVGLVAGLIGGLLLFGFADLALVAAGASALLGAGVCFRWPRPILFVAGVVLSGFGVDL